MVTNKKMKLNAIYGKLVTEYFDKNCSITVTRKEGKTVTTQEYFFDDYRIAYAVANILDNLTCVERYYATKDNASFYDKVGEILYADTDSIGEQKDA